MRLVDTNILIYAASADPVDTPKRARAYEILGEDSLALSVQVLQEFYNQSTHSHRPNRLSHEEAMRFIEQIADIPVQPVTIEVFRQATELCNRFRISYWDAAILAAAKILGCDAVYSEDMSDQQDYDGVRVINPFVERTERASEPPAV